jgi:signal peptidase II
LKNRTRDFLTIPLVAGLAVLADQVTKHFVRANLRAGQSLDLTPWLKPLFQITYVTNSGAAFGLFPNWSQVFIIIAVMVIVALVWYYVHLSGGRWLVQLALGLQLGGAIGNLIDRLRFGGYVVDFIDLSFWPLRRWPVFNIADASIVTGVTLLTLLMIWEEWQDEHATRQLATASDD